MSDILSLIMQQIIRKVERCTSSFFVKRSRRMEDTQRAHKLSKLYNPILLRVEQIKNLTETPQKPCERRFKPIPTTNIRHVSKRIILIGMPNSTTQNPESSKMVTLSAKRFAFLLFLKSASWNSSGSNHNKSKMSPGSFNKFQFHIKKTTLKLTEP